MSPATHRPNFLSLILAGTLCTFAMAFCRVCCAEPPGEKFTYVTRDTRDLHIYVTKPQAWKASDTRPAIVFFHGGGWVGGSPGGWLSGPPTLEAPGKS